MDSIRSVLSNTKGKPHFWVYSTYFKSRLSQFSAAQPLAISRKPAPIYHLPRSLRERIAVAFSDAAAQRKRASARANMFVHCDTREEYQRVFCRRALTKFLDLLAVSTANQMVDMLRDLTPEVFDIVKREIDIDVKHERCPKFAKAIAADIQSRFDELCANGTIQPQFAGAVYPAPTIFSRY